MTGLPARAGVIAAAEDGGVELDGIRGAVGHTSFDHGALFVRRDRQEHEGRHAPRGAPDGNEQG